MVQRLSLRYGLRQGGRAALAWLLQAELLKLDLLIVYQLQDAKHCCAGLC